MTRLSNTFETGLADGTAITIANSDDGLAGDPIVTATGTSAVTFQSAAGVAHRGTQYLRYDLVTATGSCYIRLGGSSPFGDGGTMAARFYLRIEAYPTAALTMARLFNGASGVAAQIRISAAGVPSWHSSTGATLYTGPAALALDTWYRIEAWVTPGTTTTTGRSGFEVYEGESLTPIATYSATAVNHGTTQTMRSMEIGRSSTDADGLVLVDTIAVDDGIGETFIGPLPSFDAAGTVAATSATEGTITKTTAADGTVAAVSATEGTITKRTFADGTVAAVSAAVGTITKRTFGAGIVAAVSAVIGTITKRTFAAGTVAAVSTTTGAVTVIPAPPPAPGIDFDVVGVGRRTFAATSGDPYLPRGFTIERATL